MVHVVQLADTHYDHGYEAEDEHQRTQQSEKVHGLDAEPGKEPKGKQVQIPVYKTVQPELGLSVFCVPDGAPLSRRFFLKPAFLAR